MSASTRRTKNSGENAMQSSGTLAVFPPARNTEWVISKYSNPKNLKQEHVTCMKHECSASGRSVEEFILSVCLQDFCVRRRDYRMGVRGTVSVFNRCKRTYSRTLCCDVVTI